MLSPRNGTPSSNRSETQDCLQTEVPWIVVLSRPHIGAIRRRGRRPGKAANQNNVVDDVLEVRAQLQGYLLVDREHLPYGGVQVDPLRKSNHIPHDAAGVLLPERKCWQL